MTKLELHPICKIHKTRMELIRYVKGEREWGCPTCQLEKESIEDEITKRKFKV